MVMSEDLQAALKLAMTENGIKRPDQYNDALAAFNGAFSEIVSENVRAFVDEGGQAPLATQVFSTDESVKVFPLCYTKQEPGQGLPKDLASIAFFGKGSTCVWICTKGPAGGLVWIQVCY